MNKTGNAAIYTIFPFLFILFLILVSTVSIFHASGYFGYSIWTDRELLRSENLLEIFQIYGPEFDLQGGKRIPGGAAHYVLFLLLQISQNPDVLNVIFLSLTLVSFLLLARQIGHQLGWLLGLVALLLLVNNSLYQDQARELWNPFMAMPFAILAHVFLLSSTRSTLWIWPFLTAVCVSVAAQYQMANIALVVSFLAAFWFMNMAKPTRTSLIFICGLIFSYSPYILGHYFGVGDFAQLVLVGNSQSEHFLARALGSDELKLAIKNILKLTHLSSPSLVVLYIPVGLVVLAIWAAYGHKSTAAGKAVMTSNGDFNRVRVFAMIFIGSMAIITIADSRQYVGELVVGPQVYRYWLPLVPSAVILSVEFIRIIQRRWNVGLGRKVLVVGLGAYLSFLTIETLYRQYNIVDTAGTYGRNYPEFRSYQKKIEVFQRLADTFKVGANDLILRTSLIHQVGDKWIGLSEPSQYIASQLAPSATSENLGSCFLIVESAHIHKGSPEWVRSEISGDKFSRDLSPFIASIERLATYPGYALVQYKPMNAACPKSLINDYTERKDELTVRDRLGLNATSKEPVVVRQEEGNRQVFMASVQLKNRDAPVTFMLTVSPQDDGSLAYIFSSKAFRNHTVLDTGPCQKKNCGGYWGPTLTDRPLLVLEGENSFSKVDVLTEGTLGRGIFRTPLEGRIEDLDGGHYELFMVFPKLRTLRGSGEDVKVHLGTINIKPLR